MTKRILNLYIDAIGTGTLKCSGKIPKQTLKLVSYGWRFANSTDPTNAKVMFLNFDFLTNGVGAYNNTQNLFTSTDKENMNGTIMLSCAYQTFISHGANQYYDMQDDIDGDINYKLTGAGTLANLSNLVLSFEYEDD